MKGRIITKLELYAEVDFDATPGEEGIHYLIHESELNNDSALQFAVRFDDAQPDDALLTNMKHQLAHLAGKQMIRDALKRFEKDDEARGVADAHPVLLPPGGAKA